MTTDFARPEALEPNRDRYGRPLIFPPDSDKFGFEPGTAGEAVAYTRVSTLAKCIEDTSNLTKWKCRMVAHGIGKRPDLATVAQVLDPTTDKGKLNALVDDAMNAAASGASANIGTALHAFCEWADSPGFDPLTIPREHMATIANYAQAREAAQLKTMAMERFVVCDELQAAGSFDRLYFHAARGIVVGDIKTGETAADYPHNIAMQVAIYAHSDLYDIATGARTPIPGVNLTDGVLVHLNQKTGDCTVYRLDIAAGWEAAQLAADVHAWRKRKGLVEKW